ncbi:5-methyltetrahydropteroyltriglutamate--homocysteine S-methyltransferase [Tribonema minus]|uniref:5-methyltetrahydropteroyltriglutamate--homocysteine S-methyltransferase n=1 Tax=Tribonema minus TaxID=303371 RepID=A0A835Z1A8_9STRA|nr:5-methyltetrahydropteroyltriglutamate--homocysteine S-methyltransferase [Tribonema minus]
MTAAQTATLGFPRIGPNRELKKAVEAHWAGKLSEADMLAAAQKVEEEAWSLQAAAGVDLIAVGDFNLYDQVLQYTDALDLVPERFAGVQRGTARAFMMARGAEGKPALDMTKFFNTNYHYNVPELRVDMEPRPAFTALLSSIKRGVAALGGARAAAVILGPVTFLHLAKFTDGGSAAAGRAALLAKLVSAYRALLRDAAALGVAELQLHEPALCAAADSAELRALYASAYPAILEALPTSGAGAAAVNVVSYFDDVDDATFAWLAALPRVAAVSLDFTRGDAVGVLARHGPLVCKTLGAGVIDARSPWRADPDTILPLLRAIRSAAGPATPIRIQPSANLQFVPVDAACEKGLHAARPAVAGALAFAAQKLRELRDVAAALAAGADGAAAAKALEAHAAAWTAFRASTSGLSGAACAAATEKRVAALGDGAFKRALPFEERVKLQLPGLPLLPTTTIGSFPQTPEVRRLRNQLKKGTIMQEQYDRAIDTHIAYAIGVQDALGLDILVHGEAERTDMVEFFGQQLEGMAFTENGWVQSYGSRCVRPPIICSDVSRPKPMTIREFKVAQSMTDKPVKGMLTGPITILNWSFPRADVDRKTQAYQLALALREEIKDLEDAGCRVIQVDEPALREGMPTRPQQKEAYLKWAVDAFLLATVGARPETQIHTHMCYCEFQDCLGAIARLDADVNSIENSRSNNSTLESFAAAGYKHLLGPGTYDIHSPVVPSVDDVAAKLRAFATAFPLERIVVGPDCGLKTRKWHEVIPALRNMVAAAAALRAEVAGTSGKGHGAAAAAAVRSNGHCC